MSKLRKKIAEINTKQRRVAKLYRKAESVKEFNGSKLKQVKVTGPGLWLGGDYVDWKEDYDNELPSFVESDDAGEAYIPSGTVLYYGENPHNGSEILVNDNNEELDVYLDDPNEVFTFL